MTIFSIESIDPRQQIGPIGLGICAVVLAVIFHFWRRLVALFRFVNHTIPEAAKYYMDNPSEADALYCDGKVVQVQLCGTRTFLVRDKEFARHVFMKNHLNYTTRFGNSTGLRNLGMFDQGVIWNTVQKAWHFQRSLFNKGLAASLLDSISVASELTSQLADKFDKMIEQQGQDEVEVNMLRELQLITYGVTMQLMLGVPSNSPGLPDPNEAVEAIIHYFKAWEYFLVRPPVMYFLSPRKYWRHSRSVKRLQQVIRRIVDHCLVSDIESAPFLGEARAAFDSKKLSREGLDQCVLEMLLAGTDTSSVTMFYTLLALGENRAVQDRVADEIALVFKQKGSSIVDKQFLDQLETLGKIFMESMRVKPVGPVVLRKALADDTICGVKVHAGDNMIIHLMAMNNDAEYHENPERFNPDRFNNGIPGAEDLMPFFGSGSKACAGKDLAMVEMRTIFTALLSRFEFSSAQKIGTIETHWDIANQPVAAEKVLIRKRTPRN